MLDIIRRHSKEWLIKLIFTVIILVFIFFFGYSTIRKGQRGGGGAIAAKVNGKVIPYGRFRLAAEEAKEFYSNLFKNNIPKEMEGQIESTALGKVVGQALFLELADDLKIAVTPQELYNTIEKMPGLQREGTFDRVAYKNAFLPYFKKKYGLGFEKVLEEDLTVQKTVAFLTDAVSLSEAEAREKFMEEKTLWTFDRIQIPATPENAPEGESGEILAKEVLQALQGGSKKNLEGLIQKHKLKKEKVEKVRFATRNLLIPGSQDSSQFAEILSMTKEKPISTSPIFAAGPYYLFQLIERKNPTEAEWQKEKETYTSQLVENKKQDTLMSWEKNLRDHAKIEDFISGK